MAINKGPSSKTVRNVDDFLFNYYLWLLWYTDRLSFRWCSCYFLWPSRHWALFDQCYVLNFQRGGEFWDTLVSQISCTPTMIGNLTTLFGQHTAELGYPTPIVHDRSRHPQSQGLVETANAVVEDWLTGLLQESANGTRMELEIHLGHSGSQKLCVCVG